MARHLQRSLSAAFVFVLVALVVNHARENLAPPPAPAPEVRFEPPASPPRVDPPPPPAPADEPEPAAAPASSPLAALGRQLQDTLAAGGTDAVTVTTTDAAVVISLADTIT